MSHARHHDLPNAARSAQPPLARAIHRAACKRAWNECARPTHRRDDEARAEISHQVGAAAAKEKHDRGVDGPRHAR